MRQSFSAVSETEDIKKYGPLTDDLLREGLKKDKGEAAQLVSWRCEDFTKLGDNYATFVTSVKIEYKEKGQGESREVSYVTKIAHQLTGSMNNITSMVFHREGASFIEILPAVNEALKEVHMDAIR